MGWDVGVGGGGMGVFLSFQTFTGPEFKVLVAFFVKVLVAVFVKVLVAVFVHAMSIDEKKMNCSRRTPPHTSVESCRPR